MSDLAAAASGPLLASAGADGNIVLWDPRRDDRLGRPLAAAGERPVTALAAQAGGTRMAWVDRGRRVLVGAGQSTSELLGVAPGEEVRALAFSPDGRRLAASAGARFRPSPDSVHVFEVSSGRRLGRPLRAAPYTRGLAFTPDGRALFAAGFGSLVRLELPTGRRARAGSGGDSIAISPDGRLLAATHGGADQGTVVLRNTRTGRVTGRLQTGSAAFVWDVAFSPDGRQVAAGDNDGNIVLWELATRRRLGEPLTGHRSRVEFIEFSPAGDLLASSDSSGAMLLWDLESRRALGPAVPGRQPSFGSGGELLASVADGGGVSVRPLDPASWQTAACALSNRNLGRREWAQFMDSDPYEPTCPGRQRGHAARVAVSAD